MNRIAIDAGHGGPNHGPDCAEGGRCQACGTRAGERYGIVEAAFTRDLADALRVLLAGVPQLETVPLTHKHETVGCRERGARAQRENCHAVISIHVNAGANARSSGGHFFYRPDDLDGQQIARAIATAWPVPLRRRRLTGEWRGGRYLAGALEPTDPKMWGRAHYLVGCFAPIPTVLVECFYASNPGDCGAAKSPGVRLQMLAALASGIGEAVRLDPGADER